MKSLMLVGWLCRLRDLKPSPGTWFNFLLDEGEI